MNVHIPHGKFSLFHMQICRVRLRPAGCVDKLGVHIAPDQNMAHLIRLRPGVPIAYKLCVEKAHVLQRLNVKCHRRIIHSVADAPAGGSFSVLFYELNASPAVV